MDASFFTTPDGRWFQPTGSCRGPWDPDACHAGPPTGLLARASEMAVPTQQLVRVTVDLIRPIPHAGFEIATEVIRSGRSVSTTLMRLVAGDGREVLTARGLHMATTELDDVPTAAYPPPSLADTVEGPFVVGNAGHDLAYFADAVTMRYPVDTHFGSGPHRVWMRTIPLLPDEEPSPFQRICPLADSGNAISRNADGDRFAFLNADLTVLLHRLPVGEWLGSDSVSRWEPSGIGLSDSLLFDAGGAVGRAMQSLLIRRVCALGAASDRPPREVVQRSERRMLIVIAST